MIAMMTFTCASFLAGAAEPANAPRLPEIAFEKYQLPNGLQVILHEDHSTPIVAVNVWYHVGSKNERPGRTGFAHLFEHMMFQGSQHYDKDYFGPLQQAGGQLNGSTNQDRTNYWETVPSNYLETALWMESDRMGFLLPAMTQEKLDNQRDVVRNERRQSYENRPYGLVYEVLLAGTYPPDHPYSWPTIGSMADLAVASREDVADFFRRYYHPANASLCLAGDFDPATAKRLVEKYFGPIPAGPKVEKVMPPAVEPLQEDLRVRMTDRVGLARAYLTGHRAAVRGRRRRAGRAGGHPGRRQDLAAVPAAGPRQADRPGRAGIAELARSRRRFHGCRHGAAGTAAGGVGSRRAWTRLPGCRTNRRRRKKWPGPSRATNRRWSSSWSPSAASAAGPTSSICTTSTTGDPGFLQQDFDRYLKVDPAAVQRVARKYLSAKKMVLEVTPGPETTITPDPREPAAQARDELAKGYRETPLPPAGPSPKTRTAGNCRRARPRPNSSCRRSIAARSATACRSWWSRTTNCPASV